MNTSSDSTVSVTYFNVCGVHWLFHLIGSVIAVLRATARSAKHVLPNVILSVCLLARDAQGKLALIIGD